MHCKWLCKSVYLHLIKVNLHMNEETSMADQRLVYDKISFYFHICTKTDIFDANVEVLLVFFVEIDSSSLSSLST